MFNLRTLLSAAICALLCVDSHAVLFDSTGDPKFNTTAPGGALADSGWQWQGQWRDAFLGTPIAPHFFITAKHVAGTVGEKFVFHKVTYTTTAVFDDPESDLRIWRVDGTFPVYAPLYTKRDEVGSGLVVIGRGTQRGAEVRLDGVLKGWQWGDKDILPRWGTNTVAGIYRAGGKVGELIQAAFRHGAGKAEAALSMGDSSGGVFIQDGAVWKLAGISVDVDGPYSTSPTGRDPMTAALFDQSGFFAPTSSGKWVARRGPGSWYATRISSHIAWINSITGPVANRPSPPISQRETPAPDSATVPATPAPVAAPSTPGVTTLTLTITGSKGSADLYMKFGQVPQTGLFNSAAKETVTKPGLTQPGNWLGLLNAPSQSGSAALLAFYVLNPGVLAPPLIDFGRALFTGMALVEVAYPSGGVEIHYTTDGSSPDMKTARYRTPILLPQALTLKAQVFRKQSSDSAPTADSQPDVELTNDPRGGGKLFRISIPAGQATFVIDDHPADGATDVWLKRGAAPGASLFDHHLHATPGQERLVITHPAAGDWYVLLGTGGDSNGAAASADLR